MFAIPEEMAWLKGLVAFSIFVVAFVILVVVENERVGMRRTALRFKLFAIRDRLYMSCADGLIPSASAQFLVARTLLNAFIQNDERVAMNMLRDLEHDPATEGPDVLGWLAERLSPDAAAVFTAIMNDSFDVFFELLKLNSRLVRIECKLNEWSAALQKRPPVADLRDLNRQARRWRPDHRHEASAV